MANHETQKNNKWKLLGLAAVVVVILAVAGPFIYIHYIEDDAPAPLALSDSTSTSAVGNMSATVAAGADIDGIWKVTDGSRAGYRVEEILFGQSTTAVGRTSDVTGSMTIGGTTVTAAGFTVELDSVSSDQRNRDNQFRGRIMNVSQYPTAKFELTQPISIDPLPADGSTITKSGTGNFTIHGVTKPVTIQLTAKRNADTIQVSSAIPIAFDDYDIPNPSFGPAQVGDDGTIEVLLNLKR